MPTFQSTSQATSVPVAASVASAVGTTHGLFDASQKLKELCDTSKCKKLEFFKSQYLASKEVNAWLGLYEVMK